MNNFPSQMLHSSGAPLLLDSNRLLLAFQSVIEPKKVETLLRDFALSLERDVPANGVPGERVNHTAQRYWVHSGTPIDESLYQKIHATLAMSGLAWIGPVYRLAGERGRSALQAPLPNVVVVKPRDKVDDQMNGLRSSMSAAAAGGLQENTEKSKYLSGYRYFTLTNPREMNAYQLRERLLEAGNKLVADIQLETMPLLVPTASAPNDALLSNQWDMTRIQASGAGTTGWDISTGLSSVVVCVLDEGCDLSHPDLVFSTPGINLGTMMPDGSPTGNHGTACAGIVAATYNNTIGVSGVAGNSRIMPVAFSTWSDTEVAAGINWATANGAQVISMSFGWNPWSHAIIDPAIQNAFDNDVVMCVATHNYNGPITYPATNPLVIAVGASDEVDNRKTPASPDGEGWGSDFGAQMAVVAPGVHIPTTDRQGTAGYNTSAGTAGDYTLTFNGTSSATPHVAGMAALVRSAYPGLSNVQVRAIIENTAEKVGAVAYADTLGRPNGTWNQEMGYGRINVYRALDFADVMIKDAPSDAGTEPFTGGNFWDFSDIVVRINDDNVFVPSDPLRSKNVERGQANIIYVRITNRGPREARNVTVNTRITPFVGLQFVYPADWTLNDAAHVSPTPIAATFASIPAGATVMAKFRIEAAQTETLYGWVTGSSWHPCLLASVNADNDYAFATAPLTGDPISPRRNNLAQRNLSVIDVLAGASAAFPFVIGNRENTERLLSLVIDRSRLPADMPLLLRLDDDGKAFPLVDFEAGESDAEDGCGDALVFLAGTRVKTRLGCCAGVLTLGEGSRFECAKDTKLGKIKVKGGDVILRDGKRYVEVKGSSVKVQIEKAPNRLYPLSLVTTLPRNARSGEEFVIQVTQENAQGTTVGGAAMIYVAK
jgi:subtilisin family serine protease